MGISLEVQTLVFLQSILLGVLLSVFYDILRAIRHTAKAGVILTSFIDGLFWCIVLIAFFLFVIVIVQGEGRGFILIGSLLGAILYFITISQLILRIFKEIFGTIKRFIIFLKSVCKNMSERLKCRFTKNKKCKKIRKKHFQFWSKRFKIK